MLACVAVTTLAACSGQSAPPIPSLPAAGPASNVVRSCADLLPGDDMSCFSLMRTDVGGGLLFDGNAPGGPSVTTASTGSHGGYGPTDLASAYKLGAGGSGQTVAIVDAYDDPTAEADLGVYRAYYGLAACTTANGCFKKLNQNGVQGSYPKTNASWGQEISLDLDMVSAVCPNCHIMLVEASSATNANLATAVNSAASHGATEISNSYGGGETGATNSAYNHPGIVITASAGDSGTGASQPASYSTVVAVGGTNLAKASNARGWSETVWSGSGSGCSAYVAKPSWQNDIGCSMRSEADTSAVADPNTGVAVYDSTAYRRAKGWLVFGGTSVSSPVIASVFALAGNAASQNAAQQLWGNGGGAGFNDVTSGSNGSCSSSYSYICNARVGYDGPTGWGTPNGTSAF
ncbi:MAG: peptidase S8 [Candidatus Eremiobacteraeota bacterium]|nr:peptidase S8 [Candidatus Eremiobacteraeota bacterium]